MATRLYLEDGTCFEGKLFGANKNVAGEVGKCACSGQSDSLKMCLAGT